MTLEDFIKSASAGTLGKGELTRVVAGVADGSLDSDQWLPRLGEIFPFAEVSHLIFWSDRVRTPEEIADEIFLRRELFSSGGDVAIRDRLVELAKAALQDTGRPEWAHNWANIVLEGGGRSEVFDTTRATDPSFERVAGLWVRSSDDILELTLNGIAILSSENEPMSFQNYRVETDNLVLHDPVTGTERSLRIEGTRLLEADLPPYVPED